MKIIRFLPPGSQAPLWGIIDGDDVVVTDGLGGGKTSVTFPVSAVRLLAPAECPKIVCVGRNYLDHIREMGNDDQNLPKEPGLFLKLPNTLADPDAVIAYPDFTTNFHYEGELVAVIGRTMKKVPEAEALDHVLGYTCAIDLTDRDHQRSDLQWTRAKSADLFCPLGPWIETELDPTRSRVETKINGEVRQDGTTDLMIFPVAQILSYISDFMTLERGDIVLTGTPCGVGELHRGDRIDVTVDGIGTLTVTIGDRP